MTGAKQHTYTLGQLIEMDIPADVLKSRRETPAAFHRRVATAVRVIEPEGRTPSACCHRGIARSPEAAPVCTSQGTCSPCRAQPQPQ